MICRDIWYSVCVNTGCVRFYALVEDGYEEEVVQKLKKFKCLNITIGNKYRDIDPEDVEKDEDIEHLYNWKK